MPAGVLRPYAPCRTAPLQAARRSCFAPSLPANIGLGGQVLFVAKLHPAIHGMATAIAWANSSRQKTGANARGCPPGHPKSATPQAPSEPPADPGRARTIGANPGETAYLEKHDLLGKAAPTRKREPDPNIPQYTEFPVIRTRCNPKHFDPPHTELSESQHRLNVENEVAPDFFRFPGCDGNSSSGRNFYHGCSCPSQVQNRPCRDSSRLAMTS